MTRSAFPASSILRNASLFGIGLACTAIASRALTDRKISRLRGKVVLITGSSRGLGLALAEQFGRAGARLVLTARNPAELVRARRLLLDTRAVRDEDDVLILPADLRDLDQAAGTIEEATRQFGRIDVLVNNAGVITVGPVENQSAQQFHEVMDSNFFSAIHCTMAVLPQMLARRDGAITNIASIGGKIAVPHLLPYTASKFAMVGFSEGLGVELRSKGIRVTTVCPGLMRTGSHRNALFTGDAEREYRWFSLSANLPGISIAAHRAARQIVCAVAAGAVEIAITPQAFLAARLAGLSPAATAAVMRAMHWVLPESVSGQPDLQPGSEVRGREWLPASTIGTSAAKRYNQGDAPETRPS